MTCRDFAIALTFFKLALSPCDSNPTPLTRPLERGKALVHYILAMMIDQVVLASDSKWFFVLKMNDDLTILPLKFTIK